jgi:RIO kinase 1
MRVPKRLVPLIEEGLVDEVIRPITSGKEAEVFVVRSQGVLRAAKVYKEATQRSFKNRADYLDGRKLRGSRRERARARGGRFAREQEEESWQTAELHALNRLIAADVRVPKPRGFMDGVLLMDLILSLDGSPAPRLADCRFSAGEARALFGAILHEVQRMLCVGIVHGDLSEYNVLLSAYGPVIIDLPQMVDAAASRGARALLLRDIANIRSFCGRFAPEVLRTRYGEEMWSLWERAALTPETPLTGHWRESTRAVDVGKVKDAIAEAERFARRPGGPAGRGPGTGARGPGARPPGPGPRPEGRGPGPGAGARGAGAGAPERARGPGPGAGAPERGREPAASGPQGAPIKKKGAQSAG